MSAYHIRGILIAALLFLGIPSITLYCAEQEIKENHPDDKRA